MEELDEKLERIRRQKAERLISQLSLPTSIVKLHTMEDYKTLLTQYQDQIIIIDFTAVWCGPCKIYGPIFEKLQNEYKDHFIFAKVDVDENRALAMQYQITGVPTTLFIKNGEILNRGVGAMNYNALKEYLESLKS